MLDLTIFDVDNKIIEYIEVELEEFVKYQRLSEEYGLDLLKSNLDDYYGEDKIFEEHEKSLLITELEIIRNYFHEVPAKARINSFINFVERSKGFKLMLISD